MDDAQLLRYSRHILLPSIGIEGQERLQRARALVIGTGGLGSPVALYLGSSGVGTLTLVDPDMVELTNLQRQIAHGMDTLGLPKVDSARSAVARLNPDCKVIAVQRRADAAFLRELVPQVDVVLDCCDNFVTRQAVNVACVQAGVPLISGAAIGLDGQLALYDPRQSDGPCYACVFDPSRTFEEVRCSTMGVLAPLVGVVGSMQATLALQLLCGATDLPYRRLLLIDGRSLDCTAVALARRADCPVCGGVPAST